jgi:predicted ATPase
VRNYGAVVGARQTGKTSLLLKLRHDLQAKYGFVFVDLMMLHGVDVAQCYRRLSKEIMEQLEDMLDSEGLEAATTGADFHDFLEEVARRSRPPRLAIILDEVGALPRETAQSLANTVRSVFSQRHIMQPLDKFVFIFSGATDILEWSSGETSPLRNVTENLYVPDLNPDETAELITTGLEEQGLTVDLAVSARVYDWTHGHPYLSQRLGALMLEMVEEGHSLAVELVDKAVERLETGDVNLQHLISSLQADSGDQAKVGEILQPGSHVHFSRNDPILLRLEVGGVIRSEKGRCVIRNRIYEDCLQPLFYSQEGQVISHVSTPPLPTPEPLEDLVQACVAGECVLYVGAGLSAQAGFPTWRPLVQDLLEWAIKNEFIEQSFGDSLHRAVKEGEIDPVADSIVSALERQEKLLQEHLREIFLKPSSLPESHRVLKEIGFSAVLTTNFDRLLERTYEDMGDRIYTPKDTEPLLEALSKREFFILKLYGTLERPETVLVAPAQYEDAIAGNRPFSQFMESLFFSRTILFVGASLEGIEDYLEGIQFRGAQRQHYALVAVAGSAWQAKENLLLRRYGIQVLPYMLSNDHPEVLEFLQKLAQKVRVETERTKEKEAPVGYIRRIRHPSRLKRVRLENIGPFDHLELELDPHWNILLGDNGVGKSTIIKAITVGICGKDAQLYADRLIKTGRTSGKVILETTDRKEYMTELFQTDREAEVKSTPGRPLEAEGWLALGFPPLRSMSWQRPRGPQLEGGQRRPTPDDLLPLVEGTPDPRLDELKQWIINLDYRSKDERSKKGGDDRYEKLIQEFFRIADRLTGDVTVQFKEVDLRTRQVKVITDDGEVPIEAVSQGTASLVGWIGVLMQRLYEIYDREERPTDQYALVLIDEIDAHMHPQWQQSLVPHLTDLFPNLQFVATTHSPLIVGGMPTEQVFRFARDEDGRVIQLEIEPDMTMGRADQVLTGSLFGLETTLDRITQKEIEKYRRLLGKRSRTPEEEEEFQWLQRMLEFRIPVPQETPAERRAQELLHALLLEQVGDKYPETQQEVLKKAEQLFAELQAGEGKKR